ncbi:HAAS signaling domain-containing protein [Actinophytocola sp.]|uniref:HAAS signaling domain-containing protein n=1 Tax=Actinophytocola sp. TaxID=1872138 RepID=UPI00389AE4AC
MNQRQADRLDRLVEDYLGAVSWACGDLPPQRRDELVEDVREHVAAARAVLYQPTEAAVRTILDRLGDPTAIAEEAAWPKGSAGCPREPPAGPRRESRVGSLPKGAAGCPRKGAHRPPRPCGRRRTPSPCCCGSSSPSARCWFSPPGSWRAAEPSRDK